MNINIRYIYEISDHRGYFYIGQRKLPYWCKTPEEDSKYMGSGKHLKNAIKSFGLDKFNKKIIISGSFSQNEIDKLEIYYIEFYRLNSNSYYNIASGGIRAHNGIKKGSKMSEEYCKKRRIPKTRRTPIEIVSKNCSEAAKKKYENIENHENLKEGWRKFLKSESSINWRKKASERAHNTFTKLYSNAEEREKQSIRLKKLFEQEPERIELCRKNTLKYVSSEEGKKHLKEIHEKTKERNYKKRSSEYSVLYYFNTKIKNYKKYNNINNLMSDTNKSYGSIKRTINRCIDKFEQNKPFDKLEYIILPYNFYNSEFMEKYK
jgi:hypothetical protein